MPLQLDYREFKGSVCFDPASGRHYGMVLDVYDGVVYESSSMEGLIANFEAAVDEYIDFQSELQGSNLADTSDRPAISIIVSHAGDTTSLKMQIAAHC